MTYYFKDSNTRPFAIAIAILATLLVAFLVWIIILDFSVPASAPLSDYYAMTTIVSAIDPDTDVVTCRDNSGNLWEFYGVEDWQVGDVAALVMDSKGTPSIYDDEIISEKFEKGA